MNVLVVDYGMGNLGSVRRALEECGAEVTVSADPAALADAARIVLPGVGAFADGMLRLEQGGWVEPLREATSRNGVPLLGICLGLQLLARTGSEGREAPGLGLLPGRVVRLSPRAPDERVPHAGPARAPAARSDSRRC
jgi:glutamine amidotransferase